MFQRRTTGSVVCPSCGSLVGVRDERCTICGRWNPGLWGFAPLLRRVGNDLGFVPLTIGTCAVLYVATLVASGGAIRMEGLMSFLAPSVPALFLFGASGAVPMFDYGRWWTVLSASWLHGSLLHILFNMLWIRQLGPAGAEILGAGRLVIVYVASGAAGFLVSSFGGEFVPLPFLRGAGFTIGASASVFGVLGALVCYGRRSGSSLVRREAIGYAVPLFLFGLLMPGVDNYAHAGGFAGGYLATIWLNPLAPERPGHVLAGLACLAASFAALALSVIHGLRYF
jgi:rhomboid protease GluP